MLGPYGCEDITTPNFNRMLLQGAIFIKGFANITKIPDIILLPCIMILCVVGSFAIANSLFDVFTMLAFGLLGYICRRLEFPIPPLTIAIVLGNLMETNLRRALIISYGDWTVFFTRPISVCIFLLALLSLFYPEIRKTIVSIKAKIKVKENV